MNMEMTDNPQHAIPLFDARRPEICRPNTNMASTIITNITTTATSTSSTTITPRIVTLEEIETITSTPSSQKDLIDAIAKGFIAYHAGDFFAAPIQTLGVAPFCFQHDPDQGGRQVTTIDNKNDNNEYYAAQTCVKSGYFRNNPYYVIKVASGGYPMPNNSGLMQVYSQKTGRLQALLWDEGVLTEMRTAAVGALAFTLFAPRPCSSTTIGMVGTGVQARYQLQWLANVTSCRKLLLYGRSLEKAQVLKEELETSGGWIVTIASNADELLSHCDVIITTTSSRQGILGGSCSNTATTTTATTTPQRRRTRLITCIGADAPGKMELDPALVQQAHVLVADWRVPILVRGPVYMANRRRHQQHQQQQ
jgi:ornithine cyclodeaminase